MSQSSRLLTLLDLGCCLSQDIHKARAHLRREIPLQQGDQSVGAAEGQRGLLRQAGSCKGGGWREQGCSLRQMLLLEVGDTTEYVAESFRKLRACCPEETTTKGNWSEVGHGRGHGSEA